MRRNKPLSGVQIAFLARIVIKFAEIILKANEIKEPGEKFINAIKRAIKIIHEEGNLHPLAIKLADKVVNEEELT